MRDCSEIAIGEPGEMCDDCIEHGCEADAECCVPPWLDDDGDCHRCGRQAGDCVCSVAEPTEVSHKGN